jgi:hypothetical protein
MTGLQNDRLESLDLTKRVFAMESNATVAPFGRWRSASGVLVLCGFGHGGVGMVGRAVVLLFRLDIGVSDVLGRVSGTCWHTRIRWMR